MATARRIKGFNVYCNDRFVRFVEGRSKRLRHRVALEVVGGSTHMGEWRVWSAHEPATGRLTAIKAEYATTIGVYVRFEPAFRSVE